MKVKDRSCKSGSRVRIVQNCKLTITGNRPLIEGIQDYFVKTLNLTKTKLNIRHKNVPDIVTLEYSGRNNIKKIYELLYKNSKYYCNEKYKKFLNVICALNEKSLSEMRLIAGTPEMVISSEAEKSERSSTIPEMEVESSDSKCLALNE